MQKSFKTNSLNRIIDANINRAKEGLRVCEEIARFALSDRRLASALKGVRHKIYYLSSKALKRSDLLASRESAKDIGIDIYSNELKRTGIEDIFYANMQRAKESIRALEEFFKLIDKDTAIGFKGLRYRVYDIEKGAVKKIAALSNPR